MKTDQNFTQQPVTQQFYSTIKNLTNIEFTKEKIELLNYGLKHSIERPLTIHFTNLIIKTERDIRLLDTKLQNSYHFMAASKLKQMFNSGNHHTKKDDYML
jgi:hypothetical protein